MACSLVNVAAVFIGWLVGDWGVRELVENQLFLYVLDFVAIIFIFIGRL